MRRGSEGPARERRRAYRVYLSNYNYLHDSRITNIIATMLKGQDVVVCVRLAMPGDLPATYPALGEALGMSASETHAAVKRAAHAGLIDAGSRRVRRGALLELLTHATKFVFPPVWTTMTRGVPTAHGAPPLSESILDDAPPPVWPHPRGTVRGLGLRPIYPSVPDAALRDPVFHEWMALLDAVRSGAARERELAVRLLTERLSR